MSGHSKWSTIKRKKAANDAKRGKLFTKLLKEIQVAAKTGGSSVDGNPRLKTAVLAAKSQSVPNDNIDRAIKRGSGDDDGVDYEEIVYEGYGPGGVAILVKALTENRNRTVAEVRHAFTKYNGSLGSSNSVAYQFSDRGIFSLKKEDISEEELFESALEAGAEDIKDDGDCWQVVTEVAEFGNVRDALEALGKPYEGELTSIPESTVTVAGNDGETLLKLLEALDDLDDVQSVVANFEMDEEEMARMAE